MFSQTVTVLVTLMTIEMVLIGGLFAAPVAADPDTEIGASGSCGAPEDGGSSSTGVDDDAHVDEPEAETTAAAVAYLIDNGGECHENDTHGGYVEAHVSVDFPGHAQVCIDDTEDPTPVSVNAYSEPCSTEG